MIDGLYPNLEEVQGLRSSGTPTQAGSFTFTVSATDANNSTGTREYTLVIDAPEITLHPDDLPTGVAGEAYDPVTFSVDGGTEPYSFTLTDDLPEGLAFDAGGILYGTPTEAGSFTFIVTATDANDFTVEREYTLTVDAPEISVIVPSLPDGRANMEYGPVRLSASGGTEPYVFELASGELPDGMTIASDGTMSGTPAEDGEFAFAVRATDAYGFEGSARATLKVEAENLPVAQNHTLEVMAGTSGTLDLTRGATGGPFTGASIAVLPAAEAGDARVERENGAYILHFAAAGTFAGTASLTYTLSNADGASEPATVTITVIARPDPSLDPEVIGLAQLRHDLFRSMLLLGHSNVLLRLNSLLQGGPLFRGQTRMNSMPTIPSHSINPR